MADKKKSVKKPSADSSAEENKRGRGRPPGSKNFKKETGVKTIKRKTITAPKLLKKCACCGRDLVLSNFYQSNSQIHKDKLSPYCKDCIWNECQTNGNVDRVKLKAMCVTLNRPYAESALTSAYLEYEKRYSTEAKEEMNDESAIIKLYFKNVNSLTQYNQYDYETWEQKELITKVGTNGGKQDVPSLKRALKQGERVELDDPIYDSDAYIDRFRVTKEILRRFGEGYSKREYQLMQAKYDFISQSYATVTAMHEEGLVNYVRYKVKEELAISRGEIGAAKEWGELASKASQKAKLDPSQLSKNETSIGLTSWSEIFQAIEQADDIMGLLPRFTYRPNDSVDFCLWNYVNYIRRLDGKPLCDYQDIWEFYEERKKAYIDQWGDPYHIFDGDTTEINRDGVQKFIRMPADAGGMADG